MSIDDQLRDAAHDVRTSFNEVDVPVFEPKSPTAARAMIAAVVLVAAGVGAWVGLGDPNTTAEVVASGGTSTSAAPASEGDVAYGTIMALTDAAPGEAIAPVFSGTQAFNADSSRILLYRYRSGVDDDQPSGNSLVVADLPANDSQDTIEPTPLAIDPTDIEDVSWDPVDPDLLWFVPAGSNRLAAVDVTTGAEVAGHEFTQCETVTSGWTSGSINSLTSRFAYRCQQPDGTTSLAAVDIASGEQSAGPLPAEAGEFGPLALASGAGFVIPGDGYVVFLDTNLEPLGAGLVEVAATWLVPSVDSDGNDVVRAVIYSGEVTGLGVVIDPVTGVVSPGPALSGPYSGATLARPAQRDGAVAAISGHGLSEATGALDADGGVLLLTDGLVQRLAEHEATDRELFSAWSGAAVSVSPDGEWLVYSSDQGGDSVNTYRVRLGQS